jgi:hypothetical protein
VPNPADVEVTDFVARKGAAQPIVLVSAPRGVGIEA